MGIQLDWEIKADGQRIKGVGEDPESVRKRRAARLRLLITIVLFITVIGAVAAFLRYRVYRVESQLEQTLRDTVSAEVTALRLGDRNAFLTFQRSATDDWLVRQNDVFDQYQKLIRERSDVRLTGHILDVEIDDPRARVHVQEIIDGVPYAQVWFYWRYGEDANEDTNDGWRHVPPDTTFWGEALSYQGDSVTVQYQGVDASFAKPMGISLDDWIATACSALVCDGLPDIRVAVVPQGITQTDWTSEDPWLLVMPSPYGGRARTDTPFSPEAQVRVATVLAERLVLFAANNSNAQYPSDAYYLQQAVISWLVGRFTLIDTQSFLISSLAANYGDASVGQLLQRMPTNANIGILTQLTGTTLDQSNLDWRDFFTWRLTLENELILRQDTAALLALYDSSDDGLVNAALSRLSQPAIERVEVSVSRPHNPSPEGLPQQVVTARIGEGATTAELQILFRLVENQWLRAS